MNLIVGRPLFFIVLIPLFLGLFYSIIRFKKIRQYFADTEKVRDKNYTRIVRCFFIRTMCCFFAVFFLVCSLAEISWGTNYIPVQRTGSAVSMVFDISYSMEAQDSSGGLSRLKAATSYAMELLDNMNRNQVSVVIAKGNGTVAIPMTEDFESVKTFLEILSPKLMTSQGTSLGSGIRAALSSFPSQVSLNSSIWLFTDCEETDSSLQAALTEAVKYGVNVFVIGFGSENETEIFAGDGKTKVKTALRTTKISEVITSIKNNRALSRKENHNFAVEYIDASEIGSATRLLKSLKQDSSEMSLSYEIQEVKRYRFFIGLAILCMILSYLLGEGNFSGGRKKLFSTIASSALILCSFTGCSGKMVSGSKIFVGKMNWDHSNYQQAIASFLDVSIDESQDNELARIYAIYGLGTTYLMQGETESAQKKFSEIYDIAPDNIKFAILYNSGIIAHRNGRFEQAADFFKRALYIDGSSADAKINLELSIREGKIHVQNAEANMIPVSETKDNDSLESAIFTIIREEEQQKWKSLQTNEENTSKDY